MILREIDINSRVIKFRASLCALSEIEKLSLIHKRKFREINSLVIRYFHEFFCQECETQSQCGKTRNSLSPIFFREINYLVASLKKLSRNFCPKGVRELLVHSVEISEILSHIILTKIS